MFDNKIIAFVVIIIIVIVGYLAMMPAAPTLVPVSVEITPPSASVASTEPVKAVIKAPLRACNHVDNIRLIGAGWYGLNEADHAKNYRAAMDLEACKKNCLDDPECKQYVWSKTGNCYSMKNEYGIRAESLDPAFASGYCNTEGRFPPTKL
ncbi:MAG: hypothetical protein ACRCZI_12455 [Cetobacterium sp.]